MILIVNITTIFLKDGRVLNVISFMNYYKYFQKSGPFTILIAP